MRILRDLFSASGALIRVGERAEHNVSETGRTKTAVAAYLAVMVFIDCGRLFIRANGEHHFDIAHIQRQTPRAAALPRPE